jgi:penicillin G amidase
VQGYLIAKDRTLQLELLRRVAEGRLAAITAASDASIIDVDIAYRHIGLHRVAKAQYDALPEGELRDVLDAYADGVSQLFRKIRSHDVPLPDGVFGIETSAFTDWTGVDSLAIGRLQEHLLSYDGDEEIDAQILLDAARTAFPAGDPDPSVARRAGLERDLFRFAPSVGATTTSSGFPAPSALEIERHGFVPAHLAEMTAGYRAAMQRVRAMLAPEGFGSNNWAVAPSRSATGHALLASDPHLPLSSPAIFWPISLDVTGTPHDRLSGVSFPGLPGIILGHNGWIAWGATIADYDVTDVYAEVVTEGGASVLFDGNPVELETIDEIIEIQGREPYTYQVKVVPHHGPIQPTITADHQVAPIDPVLGALSVRWTGLDVTDELGAILGLSRARDVDQARDALGSFDVGAQNWVLADTTGNILWTTHSRVPIRDPRASQWDPSIYEGTLPCHVLPGDGTAEWVGFVEGDVVPWEKNPARGYVATANNDPVGGTLDNDPSNDTLPDGTPVVLACSFDIGFREGRIQERLDAFTAPLTLDDMANIQGDARSALGARLGARLVDALDRAIEEHVSPGKHPALSGPVSDPAFDAELVVVARDLLVAWGAESDYQAAAGVDLETNAPLAADTPEARAAQATLLFNAWLVRVLRRTFGDELARMDRIALGREAELKAFLRLVEADPPTLATYDPLTKDSALWDDLDTPAVESRHERFVRAFVDALSSLEALSGEDATAWRWGAHHTVTLSAIIPIFGALSIPPSDDPLFTAGFPRHGDAFAIDSSDFTTALALDQQLDFSFAHGPSQRFVVDMAPEGPQAHNALPGGAVWDQQSPHFRDEAELWRKNQSHPIPFSIAEVIAAKESRTVASAPP